MAELSGMTSEFSESVAVVTVKAGDRVNAMTAAWAIPVSQRPALVVVHIAPQRYTHDLIIEAKEFGLSILADDQMEVSQHAGTVSGRKVDKFEGGVLKAKAPAVTSTPVLQGCAATMECKLEKAIAMGDHTIFVGRVVALERDEEKKPLVLHRGTYYKLTESVGKYY
ncbi:MAG: flavin reductase family protein [bacterium]|jgi:flavin reductase (DIM6/NTAB) family NADH-FMN oxidoreductase RutF